MVTLFFTNSLSLSLPLSDSCSRHHQFQLVSATLSSYFVVVSCDMAGFEGTQEQIDPDLLQHYAEEMGRGVGT